MIFHNPSAGAGDLTEEDLLELTRSAGFQPRYCSVKGPDFAARLRERADLFVVAGGDGTVQKVMTRMPDREIPLAILPLGTANNIARSLGIVGDPRRLADGWSLSRSRRYDIGLALGPWGATRFVEGAGFGCIALSIKQKAGRGMFEADPDDKMLLARNALRQRLERAEAAEAVIEVDREVREGKWLAVEVLNIAYTGPGLMLAPHAIPGDRRLEVVAIPAAERASALDWLAGPEGRPAPFESMRGSRVQVRCGGAQAVRIDDRSPDLPAEADGMVARFELEEEQVRVLRAQ